MTTGAMFRGLIEGFRHYADFRGCSTRAQATSFLVGSHLIVVLLLLPAIVELLQFWRFAVEDVRFYDMLQVHPTFALHTEAIGPVLKELWGEYCSGNCYPGLMWGSLVSACVFSLVLVVPTISIIVRWRNSAAVSLPPIPR